MKATERIRIVIVLILGMLALGLLTWGIGKVYLELVGQSSGVIADRAQNHSTGSNTSAVNVLSLPGVTFWTCQVGVFQSEGNAQLRKEQLAVLGFNAEVTSSNPWAVGVGLGYSSGELQGVRQSLAEKGIPNVPKQIVFPERTFRVAGNGSQLAVKLLQNANTVLQKGLTSDTLAKEKEIWDTQAGDYPPKELEKLHQLYNLVREKTVPDEQKALGLSLFFESQRVINRLSGK
ncbi:SPOR domain-containing protein [Desulfosporosinus sp. Sb-LF]|uniref:SPOR domain-containing protein n=1 Tax=Desulfosporosinus sp. Sb-LF TaxID=2560027 RepID=UPI00107F536C|nr:SPOR domain-containing protein [Desulfosporosinus sp. Sb-LF]TGE31934.1 SPOR domain-containing protein [Desulfosporosinus sp. Sb-LF]